MVIFNSYVSLPEGRHCFCLFVMNYHSIFLATTLVANSNGVDFSPILSDNISMPPVLCLDKGQETKRKATERR